MADHYQYAGLQRIYQQSWKHGTVENRVGIAIADIIFGDYNPGGRLPITFPRHSGQLPVYYNYKPSKDYWLNTGWGKAYVDIPATPLWEFGFGLSYHYSDTSNLQITPGETRPAGEDLSVWM